MSRKQNGRTSAFVESAVQEPCDTKICNDKFQKSLAPQCCETEVLDEDDEK